ncbi:MAG: PDZ domain-containing protein [Phycisphaerales bacterium]|nr:PDZ domain-containing protein [Phycisphaerales bacterium]
MARLTALLLSMLLPVLLGAGMDSARDRAMASVETAALAGDFQGALSTAKEWLKRHPSDADMLYNSGCAYSRLGDLRSAAAALVSAIRAGYRDFGFMEEDPDLRQLREHESWSAVRTEREAALAELAKRSGEALEPRAAIAAQSMANWKSTHPKSGYNYVRDPVHRLLLAHDLDERSSGEMRQMLESESDLLARLLFGGAQPDWVFIAVTSPKDAGRTFTSPGNTGAYDHGARSLETRDTGASLRHEFAHALHFGHMQRLGQRHPIWMIEGLASIFEDYEVKGDGSLTILPNQRHNLARKQVKGDRAESIRALATMTPDEFMRKPLERYPQVRSIFEYLVARGLLERFYREYTENQERDPTGIAAIEAVTGEAIAVFEKNWRAWVLSRAPIDDRVEPGDGALGVTLGEVSDGARITRVINGSAAAAAGLRTGDIIVSIGERAVRSVAETVEAIARLDAGDRTTIGYRRGDSYGKLEVTLLPLRGS